MRRREVDRIRERAIDNFDAEKVSREYFEDNAKEVDTELVEFIISQPELYTVVIEAWAKTHRDKMIDWMLEQLPDGPEDDDLY